MGTLGKLLIFVLFLFLLVPGDVVWAQSTDSATIKTPFESVREKLLERRETVKEKRQEAREKIVAKRDEQKVRRCEVKEKILITRTESLTRLVTNMEAKFTAIVERVKSFATDKGLTVENYDALLADIETNKTAVDEALASSSVNAQAFTCDSDDPKAALTGFREDMQAVKQALHDYRTSIKDLIVAVKQAVETANGQETETDE